MVKMLIGIPKETKKHEARVALTPAHVRLLCEAGHEVHVEKDAGAGCQFSNESYENAGAKIKDSVYDCEMIVRVKQPPLSTIRKNQLIMAYLHIEKGQNPELLNRLLRDNVTGYAYEEIRDENGNRLVNLGAEAGIVGMYEGLRLHGKILEKNSIQNTYTILQPIWNFFSVENIYRKLSLSNLKNGTKIYIMGKGTVSRGVQEVLKYSEIKPKILYRKETSNIGKFIKDADIIVNAVDWYPGEPHIMTRQMLKQMKKTAVIIDISCDENGAIESCVPTTWDNPTYETEGITHFCVDNLPSAIPRDASSHLSDMIFPHVLAVANGKEALSGIMTEAGRFVYQKILLATSSIS